MSAKPTPGPYQIVLARTGDGFQVIDQNGMQVAWFWFGRGLLSYMTKEQAEANARAFVDGMDAIETIARVREILERAPMGETLCKLREELLSAIGAPNPFTGKAKP